MTHSLAVRASSLASRLPTSLVLLSSILLVACSDDDPDTLPLNISNELQGVWERSGYGSFLQVENSRLSVYEATRATCHLRDSGAAADFIAAFPEVHVDDDLLQLGESALDVPMLFNRVDALPAVCEEPIDSSAAEMFDHVWHSFNDHYAFFNERGVDWLAQYDLWRPTLGEQSTQGELEAALIGLLSPIDDTHVSLTVDGGSVFNPAEFKGFFQDLIDEFESQDVIADEASYISTVIGQWRQDLQGNYIGEAFSTTDDNHPGLLEWGVLGDSVGYLRIAQLYTDFESTGDEQLSVFDSVLDVALTELAETSGLIIDVRLTPGGRDAVSLAVANRFADTERAVVSKAARDYQGLGAIQTLTISPSEHLNYQNPVVLITSGFSASATEVLTLLLRSLPQVTHLGESTNGALSDVLERGLPNGWEFTLSNEVYLDASGQSFEAVGIPPEVVVPVLDKAARDRGEDSAINAAFDVLGLPSPYNAFSPEG
ncbi:S41 family peptidase [Granulosicoccus sp. 3-233]|uniref:S41 family peptidase n=1 Tax=Granulosicoccus sp. 3-233 TaxID=3417969 RepID=UPI003D357B69